MSFMVHSDVENTVPLEDPIETELSTLIGSRICHDLANPLGAIGNGVELLELSRTSGAEELALLKDSLVSANGKLELFRIAFGRSSADQMVSVERSRRILGQISLGARCSYVWQGTEAMSRQDLQMVLLSGMCLELALPRGGEIEITSRGPDWIVKGSGVEVKFNESLWRGLHALLPLAGLTAKEVQFALLPRVAETAKKTLTVSAAPDNVTISF